MENLGKSGFGSRGNVSMNETPLWNTDTREGKLLYVAVAGLMAGSDYFKGATVEEVIEGLELSAKALEES